MRCFAAGIVLEFSVALPYYRFVFVRWMPGFRTVKATAVTANDFCTEYAFTTIHSAYGFSAFKFILNRFPLHRVNDGFVWVFNVVLRNFALIYLHFFRKKIYGKFLLQSCRTFIFSFFRILSMVVGCHTCFPDGVGIFSSVSILAIPPVVFPLIKRWYIRLTSFACSSLTTGGSPLFSPRSYPRKCLYGELTLPSENLFSVPRSHFPKYCGSPPVQVMT